MDTNIRTIPKREKLVRKIRVAAYARVSTGKDSMLHSLSYQVSFYSSMIQSHKNWLFSGVYADEAISGTKDERPNFKAMVDECRKGNIDMVITKSVSRFARNTVTLLKTIRELTQLGVDVFFEEQHLHTLGSDGEIILTALATYAEAEAVSMSENMKWRIQKNFQEGLVYSMTVLGYRIKDSHLEIEPDEKLNKDSHLVIEPTEAKAVKRIFNLYLEGYGNNLIAQIMNKEGYKTRFGKPFCYTSVFGILRNRTYIGDLLLQTTYSLDPISKKTMKNKGEFNMYLVENDHKPIISKEMFDEVQTEIIRRHEINHYYKRPKKESPFTHKLICAFDGRKLIRKKCRDVFSWRCTVYEKGGNKACPSKQVPELSLIAEINDVLGTEEFDEKLFKTKIKEIVVGANNLLTFKFFNGEEVQRTYKDKSRKWTPEMKEKERLRREIQNAKSTSNQSNNQSAHTLI
mgnify:CR=1 FL=1